jgi:hypothetical protein
MIFGDLAERVEVQDRHFPLAESITPQSRPQA